MRKPLEADGLIYHYGDSSVPPPYHRSYQIRLDRHQASLVVDSYGDLVASEQSVPEAGLFDALAGMIQGGRIRNCQRAKLGPCTGGTTQSLRLLAGDQVLFQGSVYHCGGKGSGDLCGEVDALADRLKELFCYFDDTGC